MGVVRISAVLESTELEALRTAIDGHSSEAISVDAFSSDLEALQNIYIKGKPDLLVLDLDLPGVIGLETVRAMRRQPELVSLPILALSRSESEKEVAEAGGTCFMTKPAAASELSRLLARCLTCVRVTNPAPPAPPARQEAEGAARAETRKAVRRPIETACVVTLGGKKVRGILKDISLSGAHVSISEQAPLQSMVTLILGIPGTIPLKIIQFKARIVRQARDGYGISFREMDPDTRAFVISYTQKHT